MEYYVCILDFEATCWSEKENTRNDNIREIIEFPSILYKVDSEKNVQFVSEFQKYVKPVLNPILSKFCTELTKITQETVNKADTFKTVYKQHFQWIQEYVQNGEKLIFYTCGIWDLEIMLPIETKRYNLKLYHHYTKYLDLKNEFQNHYKVHAGGMTNMMKTLSIQHTGILHSGIDDCRNLAKVLIQMIKDGYREAE